MSIRMTRRMIAAGLFAVALGLGASGAPAGADPDPLPPDPTYVAPHLAGTGSLTTQYLMDRLAAFSSGSASFESWSAGTGRDLIEPKALSPVTRPNGTLEGLEAFRRAQGASVATPWATVSVPQDGDHFDFVRSSIDPDPEEIDVNGALVYVPFAMDTVHYAGHVAGAAPTNLTTSNLRALYATGSTVAGGITLTATTWNPGTQTVTAGDVTLYVPTVDPDVRTMWWRRMYAPDPPPDTLPDWVFDRYDPATDLPTRLINGAPVRENDGTVLAQDRSNDGLGTNNAIVPFSASQWWMQSNSSVTEVEDRRNGALLRGSGLAQYWYNIVVHSEVLDPASPINDVFAANGFVCSLLTAPTMGLTPIPNCGEVLSARRIDLTPTPVPAAAAGSGR